MDLGSARLASLSRGILQAVFNADLQYIPQMSSLTTRWLSRAGNNNEVYFVLEVWSKSKDRWR
jgi:hypothetical protein